MNKKIIIFGGILTLVGLALILISLTEKDDRKLQGIVPQVSIDEQWYDAQIIVDAKSYPLRYRRYNPPVTFSEHFRMEQEATDISPLHSTLSFMSYMWRHRDGGATKEELVKYQADPKAWLKNVEQGEVSFGKFKPEGIKDYRK